MKTKQQLYSFHNEKVDNVQTFESKKMQTVRSWFTIHNLSLVVL